MDHTVTLRSSGKQFTVPAGQNVLEAALAQGLVLPYSCRIGSCGTCKARLIEGRVDYGRYEPSAMTSEEREQGYVLLCQAQPQTDLVVDAREVVEAEAIEIKLLPARVIKLESLCHDVMGLTLKLPSNQSFNYLPGQYVDVLLRDGRRRSFSMANLPGSGEIQFHVRRVPGGFFTNHIFTKMKERDLLRLQGPLGTFFLRDESSRPMIFMAGGTGFAPIKAIIEHTLDNNVTRPLYLYWGVRGQRDLYLNELAKRWAQDHAHITFIPVLSEPDPQWQGTNGWVHEAVLADHPDLSGFDVYTSGPPPMIEAARTAFRKAGLPADNLFFDSFEFAGDSPRS